MVGSKPSKVCMDHDYYNTKNKFVKRGVVMDVIPEALVAFANHRQFILCKVTPSKTKPGKMDKFPVDYRTARVASAHNPDMWLDAKTAISIAKLYGDQYFVGFVFTDNDPFFFLDIDNCLQANGSWSPLALELIGALPGAAVEISQSRKGLHLYGSYSGAMPEHACKNTDLGIELYHKDRFVVLTGVML